MKLIFASDSFKGTLESARIAQLLGKVLHGIGLRAKEKEVPVTAIVGGLGEGWEGLFSCGIGRIIPLVQGNVTLEDAMNRAGEVYYDAALRYFRSVKERKDRHPEMKFYWT